MTEHELFLFLVQVSLLLLVARTGGELATRIGIPLHVGELLFGMALGPSLLGRVWPDAFEALFPADPDQRAFLEIVAWIAIVFLVLLSGLETRLGILRRAQRAAIGGWIGGFGLPFVAGFLLGLAAPEQLVPASIDPPVFALFLATAMSISAIPVIARILMDMDLFRTRVGMVIISAAVADDTIGWVVLAVVTGLVTGGVETASVVRTLLLTGGFIALAFTVGRPLVWMAMERSGRLRMPHAQISVMLVITLAMGAVTQAIGVHLVLGALVAAMLIGRYRRFDPGAVEGIREVGMGFLVPFFFAYTGIKVDLTTLRGSTLVFAGLAVLVACLSKVVGGGLGARVGGLPRWEALAVGFGLNARGAMELVIAAIGLSIGVLDDAGYAIIVMIAVLTTIMAGPTMKFCVDRAGPDARRRFSRGPRGDGAEPPTGSIPPGEPASRVESRPPEASSPS
jgi:Kef-type K+ transport system membrane component KefB